MLKDASAFTTAWVEFDGGVSKRSSVWGASAVNLRGTGWPAK
jgi:hypothetical protein